MKLRGLLLGSAAAVMAVSGARAADAIVIPEPEPMEYVRVCDVYGAGFFYIPGTENCLKIGGYFRYEVRTGDDEYGGDMTKLARFAPNFDVRTETAWGTLRGFAEMEFDWYYDADLGGYTQSTNMLYGFIEVGQPSGVLRVGVAESPYSRFLDFAGPTLWEGRYAYNLSSEVSYTFTFGNGFTAIVAAVEDTEDTDWMPNFEGGLKYEQDWGSIGAMAGYDDFSESWGARATARFNVPNTGIEASLHGFYSSDDGIGVYTVTDPAGEATEWSVLAGASVAFSEQIGLSGTAQWFDTNEWEFSANLPWTPVDGLAITPEIVYATTSGDGDDTWNGRIRFQRSF
ncbi:porin [Aquamicrobium sp. LC103]|uniref:porin n=1 Tax=Aquamicrobium sp. LC103 TaxID=1120658 RepID=UPI00069B0F7E|nr:porin [Aquamicrobium sp. LC103]TKT81284.1 porin [Aquamicrobium sp. LC103]